MAITVGDTDVISLEELESALERVYLYVGSDGYGGADRFVKTSWPATAAMDLVADAKAHRKTAKQETLWYAWPGAVPAMFDAALRYIRENYGAEDNDPNPCIILGYN